MAAPSVSVGIALGVAGVTDFILDDASRGVLDGTSFTLSSGFTDVMADGAQASVTRGRWGRLWDTFDAADVTVVLNNEDRTYDPSYVPSPYQGALTPGREFRIQAGGVDVVNGFVDDWDLEYDVSGRSSAVVRATDALGMLGQLQFDAWTSGSASAGGKLGQVCDRSEVDWLSSLRDFDSGVEALQVDTVSWGSNVLNYMQLIARSELGTLFAAADGVLTFRDRNVAVGVASTVSVGDGGIPFSGIRATVGSELLFARVGVDREGGTNQTATVADMSAWRSSFGPLRSLSITGLLLDSDAQSLDLAEYLLTLYDAPRYRVSELSFELHGLDGADQLSLLGVDITSVVDVTFTPNNTGDPITQTLMVQGLRHDMAPSVHTLTWSVIDVPLAFFRLDSATYGVLDSDLLGF